MRHVAAVAERIRQERIAQEQLVKRLLAQVQRSGLPMDLSLLSEKEKRKKLAARLEWLRRNTPTRLDSYGQFIMRTEQNRPIVAQRHHAMLCHYLQARKEFPWLCIVMPPGYGKSTWVSRAYPGQRIGQEGGRIRLGLVANTHSIARTFSVAVQADIESKNYQQAFPHIRPDKSRAWRDNEWVVTGTPAGPNPTFFAAGMNGPIQSRRFDELIIDDPSTEQQARSPTQMKLQIDWISNTLFKRLPVGKRPPDGDGRVVVVCTRWSKNDVVPFLRDMGFHILHMPAIGYWDGKYDLNGKFIPGEIPLWGEAEPLEQLEALRELNEIHFELVMQGNTDILSGDMFDPAWFNLRPPPKPEEVTRRVTGIDTASGKDRKRGDYFAMATIAEVKRHVHVEHILRKVLTAPEQVEAVLAHLGVAWDTEHRKLDVIDERAYSNRPDKIVIEGTEGGAALYYTLLGMHLNQSIEMINPENDKEWRARPLASAYKAGLVHHPGHPDANGELQAERWVMPYTAECEAFPAGPHDDQVDAVSHAYGQLERTGPRIRTLGGLQAPNAVPDWMTRGGPNGAARV